MVWVEASAGEKANDDVDPEFYLVIILYSTDEDYFAVIEIYIEVLRFMTKLLLKAFASII